MKIKLPTNLQTRVAGAVQNEIDDFRAVEMARARLKAANLRMMTRPVDSHGQPLDPKLPENLTHLSSEELGDLFGHFAIMTQYAVQISALSAVERAARARIDKYTRARVRLQKSGTVQDKDAEVEIDRRVRESGFELLKGDSTVILTEALMNSYVVGRDVCSREMTRRMSEAGRQM